HATESEWPIPDEKLRRKLAVPSQGRLYYIRYAMKMGWTIDQIHELTKIDRWFLAEMKQLVDFEETLLESYRLLHDGRVAARNPELAKITRQAKEHGYSDNQLGTVWKVGSSHRSHARLIRDAC